MCGLILMQPRACVEGGGHVRDKTEFESFEKEAGSSMLRLCGWGGIAAAERILHEFETYLQACLFPSSRL